MTTHAYPVTTHLIREGDEELEVAGDDAQRLLDSLLVYACLDCQVDSPSGWVIYHVEPEHAALPLAQLVSIGRDST